MFTDVETRAMIRSGGGVSVNGPRGQFAGLFDNEFAQVGDPPVDDSAPRLLAVTSDVTQAGVSHGVSINVGPDVYVVRSVQHDGNGMTLLFLEGP